MATTYNWPMSMPYDVINVHDQTEYVEQTTVVDTTTIPDDPIAFIPFISPKGYGNDNELVYLNSGSIAKYGNPDYNKYGLSLYLARQFIDGGGNVVGMRLKDEKAMHSHVGIVANVKLTTVPMVETETVGKTDIAIIDENGIYVADEKGGLILASEEQKEDPETTKYTIIANANSGAQLSYPHFLKSGGSINTDGTVCFKGGIVYIYPNTIAGVEEASIGIVKDAKVTVDGEEKLLSDIYKIDNGTLSLKDKELDTELFTIVNKDIIQSQLDTVYFDKYTEAGSKELLESTFLKYKDPLSEDLPVGFGTSTEEGEVVDIEKDTQYTIPLFMLYSLPSGENNISFSLSFDSLMETYAKSEGSVDRFYKISIYDGSTEIEKKVSFTFSDYIYSNESMNILDVSEEYWNSIGYIPGAIETMYTLLDLHVTNINIFPGDGTNHSAIDLLFGMNSDSSYHNNYVVTSDSIDFNATPVYLKNGSMGDFTSNDEMVRSSAIRSAFCKAYEGEITDLVFDEIRFPFSFIFQAYEDSEICNSMDALLSERESTQGIMHLSPNAKTYAESRSEKTSSYGNFTSSKMAFYAESAMIRDPYTHKRIRMPASYFNAKAIPRLLKTYGYGTPLAGNKFYWDGFITNTMLPRSTNSEQHIQNHNVRINTMIEDGTGKSLAVEQITAQDSQSALSEINNAITLRKMCNTALNVAKTLRWSDLDDENINTFRTTVEESIGIKLSNAYNSLTVTAERESTNGAGKDRIHCKIYVSFKSMLKGVTYDIYII